MDHNVWVLLNQIRDLIAENNEILVRMAKKQGAIKPKELKKE